MSICLKLGKGCLAKINYSRAKMDIVSRLQELMENEARSCSMDFGCITPLYAYRMFGGQHSIEDIENGLMELRKQGFMEL